VFPWFLPDGRHFLYTAVTSAGNYTIYVGDLQSKDARTKVITEGSNSIYVPPGYTLFVRERTLMALPFDAAKNKMMAV